MKAGSSQTQSKSKPKHKPLKPRSVYVPKKPAAINTELSAPPSDAEDPQKKLAAENNALEGHLKSLILSYEELQNKYDLADDDFKSTVFSKYKLERERNSIDKEVKAKTVILEKLTEDSKMNAKSIKEFNTKISACENDNTRLQNENTQLLQDILEKDNEIRKITDSRKGTEKVDKGVNTISGYNQINNTGQDKTAILNKEIAEMYESYKEQLEGAKHQLKTVEENLLEAKEREEALIDEKLEIEEELEELQSVIRAFNKYEEKLGPTKVNKQNNEKEEKANDIIIKLANLKSERKKMETALEDSKLNAYFYRAVTLVSVLFLGY